MGGNRIIRMSQVDGGSNAEIKPNQQQLCQGESYLLLIIPAPLTRAKQSSSEVILKPSLGFGVNFKGMI